MEEDKKNEDNMFIKLKKDVEEKIKTIADNGVKSENLENLNKLMNIHKNITKEEHMEGEMNNMRYGNYGEYGNSFYGRRGVPGSGSGRYREGGNYGRRGNYRGEEIMDDMYQAYGEYNEGREAYSRGNYGAKEDSMSSLKYMLQAMEDFGMYLLEDADSEQEKNMIRQTMRKMSEK